jgi:hypothetical protein
LDARDAQGCVRHKRADDCVGASQRQDLRLHQADAPGAALGVVGGAIVLVWQQP